jgi:hypothetical protein
VACERVYSRSGKWLLALRSVKRSLSLSLLPTSLSLPPPKPTATKGDGQAVVSLVHLLLSLSLREKPHANETVEKVIKEEVAALDKAGLGAKGVAQRYAAEAAKGTLLERISASIALHLVGEKNEAIKMLSLDGLNALNTPVDHGEQVIKIKEKWKGKKKKKKKTYLV